MKLLGVVILAVLLLACAGMSEARMPAVGDEVRINVPSFQYLGVITGMDETMIALNCSSIQRMNLVQGPLYVSDFVSKNKTDVKQVCVGKGTILQLDWFP